MGIYQHIITHNAHIIPGEHNMKKALKIIGKVLLWILILLLALLLIVFIYNRIMLKKEEP